MTRNCCNCRNMKAKLRTHEGRIVYTGNYPDRIRASCVLGYLKKESCVMSGKWEIITEERYEKLPPSWKEAESCLDFDDMTSDVEER